MQKAMTQSRADPDVCPLFYLTEVEAQLIGADKSGAVGLDKDAQRATNCYAKLAGCLPSSFIVNQKQRGECYGQFNTFALTAVEPRGRQCFGHIRDLRGLPPLLGQETL